MNKIRIKTPNSPSKISPEAMEILLSYPWPGNVRELENGLQRSMVMASGSTILPQHLPKDFSKNSPNTNAISTETTPTSSSHHQLFDQLFDSLRQISDQNLIETVQKEFALRALKASENDDASASKLLGVTKTVLKKWIS